MSTITFAHEIDTMSRRDLKTFIKSRGRTFADCINLEDLRIRARTAFNSPRNSKIITEVPIQVFKERMEEEQRRKVQQLKQKLTVIEKQAPAKQKQGKLITAKTDPAATTTRHIRKTSSERTLATTDEVAEKRHISFHPKKGKLGISLVDASCEIATIRENSQAHWAGVHVGWVIRKVNGTIVVANDVKPGLRRATTSRKTYSIDFDTRKTCDYVPLSEKNPAMPAVGPISSAFQRTHKAGDGVWASPVKEIDEWATAGGAGPRRSVMPGKVPKAPGLKFPGRKKFAPAVIEEVKEESEPTDIEIRFDSEVSLHSDNAPVRPSKLITEPPSPYQNSSQEQLPVVAECDFGMSQQAAEEVKHVETEEVGRFSIEEVAPVDLEEQVAAEPVTLEEVKQVETEDVKQVETEEVKPVETEEVKPVETEELAPVDLEEVKQVETEDLEGVKQAETEELAPVDLGEAKQVETEELAPADLEEAKQVDESETVIPVETEIEVKPVELALSPRQSLEQVQQEPVTKELEAASELQPKTVELYGEEEISF